MKRSLFVLFIFILAVSVFSIVLFLFISNKSKGALQITSTPNAKVYLNDKFIGNTPLCKCDIKNMIAQGDYTLKLVSLDGNFEPFEQKITIEPKILTVVDRTFAQSGMDSTSIVNLNAIDNKNDAQIYVNTYPQAAQVFVDNALKGQSPVLLKNIKSSDHELKLVKAGYYDKIIRIRTLNGFRLNAIIFLSLNPSVATSPALLKTSSMSAGLNSAQIKILQTPTGFLRVRSDASLSSDEVSQVFPGDTFDLVDETTGWFEIKLSDGKIGWISSQYASKTN